MCFNLNSKMPNSKQWKVPTWETTALESWLDCATHPSKSFGERRALDCMKLKVFLVYGCALKKYSSMDVNCQTPFPSLSIMASLSPRFPSDLPSHVALL